MLNKTLVACCALFALSFFVWGQSAVQVKGKAATGKHSVELMDRGAPAKQAAQPGGGPTGPIPIFVAGGSPTAIAAGAPAAGAFPGTGLGGFFGNLFPPGPGYPPSFLTGGTASGFVITGAYAWHSPFTAAGAPGGSLSRNLVAAAAAIPTSPFAPAATGGFVAVTVSAGAPGPAGIVGGPGVIVPTPGLAIGLAFPACFCGMAAGGPGFVTGWPGNGLGASLPPASGNPPLRVGFFPPFFAPGSPLFTTAAPPQNFIAGCFAAGATTPVELQNFSIE